MASGGYGDLGYWNTRYESSDSTYDWYLSYADLKEQMTAALAGGADRVASLNRAAPVLVVGCGNSLLSEDLYNDSFTDILSIDYSEVVIDKMKQKYAQTPALRFEQADVRELPYRDGSFQYVIDKGTLDAILCGSDSERNAMAMLRQIERILVPKGRFIVVTYGNPDSRLNYLSRVQNWEVTYEVVGGSRYMYTMRKLN
eukprot:TRINITY_DN2379_c0_g1_i1.p1 TRINITY_DN2379_c0_g1~~TRINITY_DN2379_c0_g1_i1.p1  ORF type:complete len:226 (+),score=82.28 TRINITY_DN2379_c0_g1_i1:83-679(+)